MLIVDENASMAPPPKSNLEYYDWLGNMAIALDADYRAAAVGNDPASHTMAADPPSRISDRQAVDLPAGRVTLWVP